MKTNIHLMEWGQLLRQQIHQSITNGEWLIEFVVGLPRSISCLVNRSIGCSLINWFHEINSFHQLTSWRQFHSLCLALHQSNPIPSILRKAQQWRNCLCLFFALATVIILFNSLPFHLLNSIKWNESKSKRKFFVFGLVEWNWLNEDKWSCCFLHWISFHYISFNSYSGMNGYKFSAQQLFNHSTTFHSTLINQ